MKLFLWTFSLLLLILFQICNGDRKVYYLAQYQNNVYKTLKESSSDDSSLVLKLSYLAYQEVGNYSFVVKAPDSRHRILATIQWLDTPNEDPKSDDQIKIIIATGIYNENRYAGPTRNMPSYFYADNLANYNRIIFELEIRTRRRMRNFEITLTAARNCYNQANKKEFACSNNFCINKDFKCDRVNHCGDNSDEIKSICSRGTIIGFSIGGVVILAIIAVACFVIIRRRYGRSTTTTSTIVIPPQTHVYPGPEATPLNPPTPNQSLYPPPAYYPPQQQQYTPQQQQYPPQQQPYPPQYPSQHPPQYFQQT